MSKVRIIYALSIWVAILPYLGFPYSFKNILFSLTGLALIYFTYSSYKTETQSKPKEEFDNFSENTDFREKENN